MIMIDMHEKVEQAKRGSGSGIMDWAYDIWNTLVENTCFQIFLYSFYVISIFLQLSMVAMGWLYLGKCPIQNLIPIW